ncbi:MAG: glycosyltransferase family 4 protein [Anaerolineae bacterium]|nr:glycosyltransferase family 4 protein [Anaerolineae bacterium]
MKLTLFFDHRFYQDASGVIFSHQNYNYDLFASRYLNVFDEITIVARVSNTITSNPDQRSTQGKNIHVVSLGDWYGITGFLKKYPHNSRVVSQLAENAQAILLIVPGMQSLLIYRKLISQTRPYGLEVVGDPYDVFSKGSSQHPLRLLLRYVWSNQLQAICASADAVSYVTQYALQKRYPASKEAFSTHVSDVQANDEAYVAEGRPIVSKKCFKLIIVGTLNHLYKAPDILIDAMALNVEQGMDLRLVIVGDGKHRAELESRAARAGLAQRIQFVGQLPAGEAVRAQLDQADLFVLPSYQEGLPRAMVEAMARGLPCIGSTVGGIPELLPPEDMVEPGDVEALAAKIREVLTNPERLAAMSARNLEKARAYHEDQLRARRIAFYTHLKDATASWLAKQP